MLSDGNQLKNGKVSDISVRERTYYSTTSVSDFDSTKNNDTSDTIQHQRSQNIPKITDWRRAVENDKKAIRKLQLLTGDVANLLYKTQDIDELIKTSYVSIVQFDSRGSMVSFTAYDCFPDIPALSPFWKEWLAINYRLEGIDPRNVLFIHYMVWQPEQKYKFLPVLLKTLFSEFLYLKYLIVVKPPKADVPDFYTDYFIPVLPPGLEEFGCDSVQLILLCLRSSVIHPLHIRTVLEHDLDFVMSVVRTRLSKEEAWALMDFEYKKNKKTLICEKNGHMNGVMVLNLTVDLDLLNESFDLTPFNGLRKSCNEDEDVNIATQKKSFAMDEMKSSTSADSRITFPNIEWDDIDTSDVTEESDNSLCSTVLSSVSLSFYRSISQFSLLRLGSVGEIKNGESKPQEKLEGMKDINVVLHKSEGAITHFFPQKLFGATNAFLIEFFALDYGRINERLSSFDFLEAAFKTVPDRDYCMLLMPSDILPFPLMDLFVRVTPKLLNSIKKELYLFHKNLLSVDSLLVRSAKADDLLAISWFLKDVDEGGMVYKEILTECFEKKNEVKTFVLTAGEIIVGVSLINPQIENFHMYFEIDDSTTELHRNETKSVIKHLVISPIYHNHTQFFIRDIMRLVDVTCVYHTRTRPKKSQKSLVTVLGEFAPIHPLRKAGMSSLYQDIYISESSKQQRIFNLYFLTPPLCGFHKIHLNIVIVVVGASRTALAFLENLIYGPASYLYKYNNLICVTPQELRTDSDEENIRELMLPVKDNFSRSYVTMLSLETYVSFVYGIMTAINRSEKYIMVNNKSIVRYDYLILTCGLQFLTPKSKIQQAQVTKKIIQNRRKSSLSRFLRNTLREKQDEAMKILDTHHPNNMFIINTSKDAQIAVRALQSLMQKLKTTVRKTERKIIVYGRDLQVFLTIHTLLKLGVPGEYIVLVEPFPSTGSVTLFNDNCVDQAVLQSVIDSKVSYYTEYFLHDWSMSAEDNITAIKFHSTFKQIDIPCLAFFPFVEKLVSDVTFNACNNAGLVYDGKLVINHNFRTNDKHIYAAGSFTKYSNRYYANDSAHEYFNAREVGQKLAEIIQKASDPLTKDLVEEKSYLVPRLIAPVHVYCQLPGDFNLFMLRKPGKELDLETAYNMREYGEVLTTGDCQMKKGFGYFRLHLNPEGFVESITCYTKDKIDYMNLSALYGLHEKILNNLLYRFDTANITDFFEYFRQPWAMAIFHDGFRFLRSYNYEAFLQKISDQQTFVDKVVQELSLNEWERLSEPVLKELGSKYLNSKIHEDVKDNLMQFLEYYKDDLPVYAVTSKLEKILARRESFTYENQGDK